MAARFEARQLRQFTVAAWAVVVLFGGSVVDLVARRLGGIAPLPRAVEDVLAAAAVLGIVAVAVTVQLWHGLIAAARPDINELTRRRAEEEDRRRQSAEQRERIRDVLRAGESLQIVFQPFVDLVTDEVVGYEALSRFEGDRRPDEWFAEAHHVGLGLELELLAVRRAFEEPRPRGSRISVNVSPTTFCSHAFLALLEEWVDVPGKVTVELTEHAVVDDYEMVRGARTGLQALGVDLAVDDAGSGYASMRHIIDLGPEVIKLDRSLVAAIDGDAARRSLAMSLVQFASEVGSTLVAEGIERPEELEACREIGIRVGQGYLLGRPASFAREPH
jgi:EAL domain-containing protein (putative c-di-GMP-specific phosphodiesterase class I)